MAEHDLDLSEVDGHLTQRGSVVCDPVGLSDDLGGRAWAVALIPRVECAVLCGAPEELLDVGLLLLTSLDEVGRELQVTLGDKQIQRAGQVGPLMHDALSVGKVLTRLHFAQAESESLSRALRNLGALFG